MYKVMTTVPVMATIPDNQCCEPNSERCGLCGAKSNSFKKVGRGSELTNRNVDEELRGKVHSAYYNYRSSYFVYFLWITLHNSNQVS